MVSIIYVFICFLWKGIYVKCTELLFLIKNKMKMKKSRILKNQNVIKRRSKNNIQLERSTLKEVFVSTKKKNEIFFMRPEIFFSKI